MSEVPVLGAVTGIISSIAEIMSYFQINYDIKGQDFTLDQQALISIVAGNIKKVSTYLYNFNMISESEVISGFKDVVDQKQKLDATVDRIKKEIVDKTNADIEKLTAQTQQAKKPASPKTGGKDPAVDELKNAKAELKEKTALVTAANTLITNSENLSKAFSAFTDSITKSADEKAAPLLVKAALRKYIKTAGITHLLNLKILSSGGEAITQKSRMLFLSGYASFIGGNVISYILATTKGEIVSADSSVGLGHLKNKLSGDEVVYRKISLGGTGKT